MNVNSNYNTPNFEARIKIKAPNMKTLSQSVLGAASLGLGTVAAADAALSAATVVDTPASAEILNSIDNPTVDAVANSHNDFLHSARGRYDNAGYSAAPAVQSTVFPAAYAVAASQLSHIGGKEVEKASGVNPSSVFTPSVDLINSTLAPLSASQKARKAAVMSSLLGSGACSIYAGINGIVDTSNTPNLLENARNGQYSVNASTVAVPVVGSLASTSNPKSVNKILDDFVTIEIEKDDKKLPS